MLNLATKIDDRHGPAMKNMENMEALRAGLISQARKRCSLFLVSRLSGSRPVVVVFSSALVFTCLSTANAVTIPAASVSLTDVTAAVTSAAHGDTVQLPAGVASWTRALTVTKGITLQGAGIGQTIILDGLPANAPNPQSVLVLNTPANKSVRVTGFQFQPDPGGRTVIFGQGTIQGNGSSHALRIDHCKFDQVKNRGIYFSGQVFGVVDHCEFVTTTGSCINVFHGDIRGPNGEIGSYGDGSWSTPTNLGSANAIYFEDNIFINPGTVHLGITDSYAGARWVFRHNTMTNCYLDYHGTGSSGRWRGTRLTEIYQNTATFIPPTSAQFLDVRSGTGVCWGNTTVGYNAHSWATPVDYRSNEALSIWGGADGRQQWDSNDTTGGPNSDGIYLTGTAGSGSSGLTLVVTGANFSLNQWIGYAALNLDQPYTDAGGNHFDNTFGTVLSSTSNSMTVNGAPHPYATVQWHAGDHFEVRKVIRAIDSIGNAQGDYLGGGATPSPRWLHEGNEPYYFWSNTNNGTAVGAVIQGLVASEGGVINNGTTARPGYTPYTYPHPLVSGGGGHGHGHGQ